MFSGLDCPRSDLAVETVRGRLGPLIVSKGKEGGRGGGKGGTLWGPRPDLHYYCAASAVNARDLSCCRVVQGARIHPYGTSAPSSTRCYRPGLGPLAEPSSRCVREPRLTVKRERETEKNRGKGRAAARAAVVRRLDRLADTGRHRRALRMPNRASTASTARALCASVGRDEREAFEEPFRSSLQLQLGVDRRSKLTLPLPVARPPERSREEVPILADADDVPGSTGADVSALAHRICGP